MEGSRCMAFEKRLDGIRSNEFGSKHAECGKESRAQVLG
jgi:hypothetical protein